MKNNAEIAEILRKIADHLELEEDNPYRIRAYRRAANSIEHYAKNVAEIFPDENELRQIPNVGEGLALKLKDIILGKESIPPSKPAEYRPELLEKKIKNRVYKIHLLTSILTNLLEAILSFPEVEHAEITGEYRRKKELVDQHITLLVSTKLPAVVINQFHSLPTLKYLIHSDACSSLVQLKMGAFIHLECVSPDRYFKRLIELTGDNEHFSRLMEYSIKNNLVMKEISSEQDFYKHLQLSYIPPELRDHPEAIPLAAANKIPQLITLKDVRGDLHCHTNETDGTSPLHIMAETARARGYEYIAITDHTQSLHITNGMDAKRVLKQIKLIDKLNEKLHPFVILKSMEVDILADGQLDLPNDILRELDLTVCSIHSKFKLDKETQTERVLRAMDNPYFNILGHATGRLLQHRPAYQIDIDRILLAAKEKNCFLELNAQPARLDINDIYCRKAKALGVKIAISSDAHTPAGFHFMSLGVNQARRGWLEANDVINTYSLKKLKQVLRR